MVLDVILDRLAAGSEADKAELLTPEATASMKAIFDSVRRDYGADKHQYHTDRLDVVDRVMRLISENPTLTLQQINESVKE